MKHKLSTIASCIGIIIVMIPVYQSYKFGKDIFNARIECNKLQILDKKMMLKWILKVFKKN